MKNLYKHKIDLKSISIPNTERKTFAQRITELDYRGYEVEEMADGRKIVITKPGGKKAFGRPYKEDIMVFIYNPSDDSLWQISHDQIYEDIKEKVYENTEKGKSLLLLLKRVFEGQEPNDFINEIRTLIFSTGENPEALLKAYKWIWGQEDVNYPTKEGRFLSWHRYEDLLKKL
jgi:hypothetical protein